MTITPEKLRWQCRRGMLELDLLLLPFFEKNFAHLSEVEKCCFERLLACNDQELYNWLIKHEIPPDKSFISLIDRIRTNA